ncbi:hypothetical protein RRG08_027008 [Elysia crispata]|uniref:Uncharacterized protein n=1 Tax=Elysia crispata TaxID=231223 RepID=A0AAE1AI61_9GAST|nr:hypothetical protein RRG08_027008 [Elysia crispata]
MYTRQQMLAVIACLIGICVSQNLDSFNLDNEYRLVRDLMKGYNKQVKPAVINNQALNVSFGVALAQIIDLDEKNQIITTNCWNTQKWLDPKLTWEPSKYGNITVVRLPYDTVWLPDIVLYNSAHLADESVSTNVIVLNNGTVIYLTMVIYKSSCSIDVKYFPFDSQHCTLDFSSWSYDLEGMNLILLGGQDGDLSNYKNSTEWELVGFLQERKEENFSCCEVPYPFIKNHILIKRRPLFYVFNMIFPCVLITLVALLGFYMPSDTGEKISMGITTLLSMTVFLMIVADQMPPTSDNLPLVGLFYGITIAIVSSATGMTVFVLNIHHKGQRGREVPRLVKKIFFGIVARLMFLTLDLDDMPPDPQQGNPPKGPKGMQPLPQNDYYSRFDSDRRPENGGISPRFTRKFTPATPSTPNSDNTEKQFLRVLQKVYQTIEKNEMRLEDQDRRDAIKNEWQQLALVIDRLLLFLFLTFATAITIALILPGYLQQMEDIP